MSDVHPRYTVDPHHSCCGIADHATGAAGVAGSDDTGQITDSDLAFIHDRCDRRTDHGSCDIVEKTRHRPDDKKEYEATFPIVRQNCRYSFRQSRLAEVIGQDLET